MYRNFIKKIASVFMIALFLLITYGCNKEENKGSEQKTVISEAEKFRASLDNKRFAPGVKTADVFNYLFDKGIPGSFMAKRGDGDLRLNIYTFSDNSKIIVISRPKGRGQGLEFLELKVEK